MGGRREKKRMTGMKPKADVTNSSVALPTAPARSITAGLEDNPQQSRSERDENAYQVYHSQLLEAEQKMGESFDKWILTLAGVAFGFSVSVVKDYFKPSTNADLQLPWLLYGSWFLFGLPLALGLFNQQVGYSAYKKCRKIADKHFASYNPTTFWQDMVEEIRKVKRSKLVEAFNWVSLFSFVTGLTLLGLFVSINCMKVMQPSTTQPAVLQTAAPRESRLPSTQ